MKRLLLVGLAESTAAELMDALSSAAIEVLRPETAEDEAAAVERLRPDLICRSPRDLPSGAKTPFVVIAERAQAREWMEAVRAGASDYLAPPFLPGQLDGLLAAVGGAQPMWRYLSPQV